MPARTLIFVGDSSFAAIELIAAVRQHVCLITRLRLDANLFKPAPKRRPGQRGRPRLKGRQLPKLSAVLDNPKTVWSITVVSQWYNAQQRKLLTATGTAIWYHSGLPPVPIRWVLVRDPSGEHDPQAFLSTDLAATPATILGWFVSRWRVETTFQEVRAHLGVETQRQWSDLAILRTTPALLGLFSLITVWPMAWRGMQQGQCARTPPPGIASRSRRSVMPLLPSGAFFGLRRIFPCPGKPERA